MTRAPGRVFAASLLLALLRAPWVAADVKVPWAELAQFQGDVVTAVDIAGHEVTRPYVILREIETPVGEPLSLEAVAADVQRLENLAIFADIRVTAQREGEGVRLVFHFREAPSWFPFLALSYSEENGFSGGPGVAASNLAGRDITLSARAVFGGTSRYFGRLSWPWIAGDHVSLDLEGGHLERDDTLREFQETSDELTPRIGLYLGRRGRLAGMFSLLRMRSDVPGKTLGADDDDLLVRVGAAAGWDTRDSWTQPRRGWLNELEVYRTGGPLGGDGDFWTLTTDLRRWTPVGARQRLLVSGLLSYQTGRIEEDVPLYMDYRMGGANSIRGYDVEDLGKRLHGKSQLIGTAEHSVTLRRPRRIDVFRWSLRLGLELALFGDAGIAWNEPGELNLGRVRGGVGAGLRILTPASEMMRLDVGWSPEGGFQFHLGGGSKPKAQRRRLR